MDSLLSGLLRLSRIGTATIHIEPIRMNALLPAVLVKLFGRPEQEQSAFSAKAGRVRDIGVSIAMSNRYFFTALTLVASVATAIAYGVGGTMVINFVTEYLFQSLVVFRGTMNTNDAAHRGER